MGNCASCFYVLVFKIWPGHCCNLFKHLLQLQDSVQSLKLGLVQIDDTASLEKFSDYAVDQDVIAYVVDVKEEVSRIIMCLRSRSEGVRATIQKAKTDLADLEKKREPLLSKLLKIAENEKIVRLELETLVSRTSSNRTFAVCCCSK